VIVADETLESTSITFLSSSILPPSAPLSLLRVSGTVESYSGRLELLALNAGPKTSPATCRINQIRAAQDHQQPEADWSEGFDGLPPRWHSYVPHQEVGDGESAGSIRPKREFEGFSCRP
jgi:hypothetical protein